VTVRETTHELDALEPWDPTVATAPPADAPGGTIVAADLIIRPDHVDRCSAPHFVPGHRFVVVDGACFVFDIVAPETTHVVTRYRTWRDDVGDVPTRHAAVTA